MRIRSTVSASLVCLTALVGCSSGAKPPVMASSSGQMAYASGYGDELASVTKGLADADAKERQLSAGFAGRVDELKKPDWQIVERVIRDSDRAGKSADFADTQGKAGAVKQLWNADKSEITARVNGGAQHSLKQAGCTADTSGAIAFALNDAMNKALQKKLRSSNEAFVVIERYKTSLGAQNVASLEKLADEIAEASYLVHISMVEERNRLDRLVSEKSDVKRTLDRFIEEEEAFQNEPGRTEAEKRASRDRVTAANKNRSELDAIADQAAAASKDMDEVIEAAKKDYRDALEALEAKVSEKKSAA